MELQFKTRNPKQIEAAEAWINPEVEEILYGGGKGGAKSYTGVSLIFGSAHIYPETNWFIARKELIDLKKFTIPSIHEVHQHWGLDIKTYLNFDGQLNVFTLPNKSKVFLIACPELPSDPLYERFGSMQMTGGWLEEAGEIPEAAKANLVLSIGRWKNDTYNLAGKLFITANPKKGWMKRDFVDPFRAGTLPKNKRFIQALVTDNPYLPEEYKEKLRNEKDPVRRQRLYEGNWDYDENADSLLMRDALTDAFSTVPVKDGNRYMIVDVARQGDDSTVISYWDGLEWYKTEKFQKQATNVTEQTIKDRAAEHKVPFSHIMIDEDGIGGGVVDHLFGVKGFVANSSPLPTANEIRSKESKLVNEFTPKTNFKNLKSQCGWKLAEMLNEHKIGIKCLDLRDVIIEEVSALLRNKSVDSEGKLQLKPKEDVKIELGRSPDVGDTMIYRMWFELQKDANISVNQPEHIIKLQMNQFSKAKAGQPQNSTK